MYIEQNDLSDETAGIGSKTKNLKRLVDFGFSVPPFLALPTSTIIFVWNDFSQLVKLCNNIRDSFPKISYAVRSSSLLEDGEQSSMAGQFHTEIDIPPERLETAIRETITKSQEMSWGKSDTLSLIVQEYVPADFSGVCFTRNPNGSREMVVEYHAGIGEDLVSGKIVPTNKSAYWNERMKICGFDASIFQDIELRSGFPQDIEWCVKNGKLYFLQTRPITTISHDKYQELLFVDQALKNLSYPDLEKTEVSEIAARPSPFTLSLLQRIYEKNGPVMNVYTKHRITYVPNDFLRIVGNELYIDRDSELKTLLSTLDFSGDSHSLWFHGIASILTTVKNIFHTLFLKSNDSLVIWLKKALDSEKSQGNFAQSLQCFLSDYEIIFEVNIFAAKYLKKLELLLKNEKIGISEILWTRPEFFNPDFQIGISKPKMSSYIGNTLEISDEDVFFSTASDTSIVSTVVFDWWNALPDWRKNAYRIPVFTALIYQQYREFARILMIKNLNELRKFVLKISWMVFWNPRNAYFHTIGELLDMDLNEVACIERKREYDSYAVFHFPSKLSRRWHPERQQSSGISQGEAQGYLVTETMLDSSELEPKILYTDILSPRLTRYFPSIQGIVSENWGFLSHLAIIAREKHLPVLVVGNRKYTIGEYVKINGSTGEIEIVSKSLFPVSLLRGLPLCDFADFQ